MIKPFTLKHLFHGKIILLMVFFAFSLSACQKQDISKVDSGNNLSGSAQLKSSSININPSNPNNAYDSLGFHYNALLTYYSYRGLSKNTPEDSLIVWNSSYSIPNFGLNNFETIENSEKFEKGFSKRGEVISGDEYIQYVTSDYGIGLISNNALHTMVQIIDLVGSDSENLNSDSQIQAVIDNINDLENHVTVSNMSENDKLYILSQSAVLTYSLSYWYQEEGGSSNQGISSTFSYPLNKSELSEIAFADARGAQMAISTGAAEWGSLMGGPGGGLAVIVAYSAAFSAAAYYVITHH